MSTATELQERVDRLEHDLDEIKEFLMKPRSKPDSKAWLNTFGIFKNDSGFQEMVRLGREYRESQSYPEDK